MHNLWYPACVAVVLIIGGVWLLCAPLDTLWQGQERALLARGLEPRRSDEWESSVRTRGGLAVGIGVAILIFVFADQSSTPTPMSGVTVNGRALTQQEWDNCHHDFGICMGMYGEPGMNGNHPQ